MQTKIFIFDRYKINFQGTKWSPTVLTNSPIFWCFRWTRSPQKKESNIWMWRKSFNCHYHRWHCSKGIKKYHHDHFEELKLVFHRLLWLSGPNVSEVKFYYSIKLCSFEKNRMDPASLLKSLMSDHWQKILKENTCILKERCHWQNI